MAGGGRPAVFFKWAVSSELGAAWFSAAELREGVAPALEPGLQDGRHFREVMLVVLPSAHGSVADRLNDLSIARCVDESLGAGMLPRRKHGVVPGQAQKCAELTDCRREVGSELFVSQLVAERAQQGPLRVPEAEGAGIGLGQRGQI